MMDLYIKLSVCVSRLIPGRGFYAQISSEITSEFPGVTQGQIVHLYSELDLEHIQCFCHCYFDEEGRTLLSAKQEPKISQVRNRLTDYAN